MKWNSPKQDLKKPIQETTKVTNEKLLSNSLSCPELCGEMMFMATGNPRVEPKEPALAMGLVNMGSDNFDTDESSGGEGSSTFERSMSDSEINYCHLGDSSGEQSGRWYFSYSKGVAPTLTTDFFTKQEYSHF